ncbi:MAG TPA: hypothetical protein VG722_09205 [Tepidisphaeraceae bacterium]|nr:hypothetical protein [Tepidisphaeraceae bacterium]
MPCLFGCLSLFFPRIAIVLIWLFSHYLDHAYQTWFWPFLGFLFMPVTTLAYAFAINSNGRLDGIYLVIFVIAVLVDLGLIGSSAHSTRRMRR